MFNNTNKKIDKILELLAVQDARINTMHSTLVINHDILSQYNDRLNILEDRKGYVELVGKTFPGG